MNRMEELRVQRMMRQGCVCCAHFRLVTPSAEAHHILSGGRRMGDWFTIPLCRSHHQGGLWSVAVPEEYRVSINSGSKAFEAVFPTERELWELVQERLGLSWPVSTKIVPRVVA